MRTIVGSLMTSPLPTRRMYRAGTTVATLIGSLRSCSVVGLEDGVHEVGNPVGDTVHKVVKVLGRAGQLRAGSSADEEPYQANFFRREVLPIRL